MARRTRNQRKQDAAKANAQRSTLLSTYRPAIDQILFALAIIGVIVTVHLWIQQGRGFDQGCWGFNPPSAEEAATFNCEAVVQSDAGKMFGISNVYWGMGFYALLAILGFMVPRAGRDQIQRFKQIRAGLIGLGFLYSVYLVNVQVNALGEYCALCLTSAGIMTLMFIIQLYDLGTSKKAAEGESVAPSPNFYKAVAGVAAVLIIADLIYFNNLDIKEPVAASAAVASTAAANGQTSSPAAMVCEVDPKVAPLADYQSLLSSFDPVVGPEDSPVTVIEFFDPNCPSCQAVHPTIKQIVAKYQDRVRFHLIPFPLREASLQQMEALYVAKEQNKFFEMLDAQMAMRETRGLPLDQIRELAKLIGVDEALLNNRLRSGLYRRVIIEQSRKASGIGMNTVPTLIVNGQFILQKTPECISQFIDAALPAS